MPALPAPPSEVAVVSRLTAMAPKMQVATLNIIKGMTDAGFKAKVFETLRTPERQAFLYGFGRKYDDGRGVVTKVDDSRKGWHHFGLAVDIVEADATPWTAPQAFWKTLGSLAEKEGLAWGGRWKFLDLPHSQWGICPASPTNLDRALEAAEGIEAVWAKYKAV